MAAAVKLLFVCSGNTCRSPLAAAVTRALAGARGLELFVDSAGIAARSGSPASAAAVAVGRRHGFSLEGHRARQFSPADLATYDLVLAMTGEHVGALRAVPGSAGCADIRLLARFAPELDRDDIPDPWGAGDNAYARTLGLIEVACARLVERLAHGPGPGGAIIAPGR